MTNVEFIGDSMRYWPNRVVLCMSVLGGCSKPEETVIEHKVRAAVVTDVGGIGDMSFSAMAWEEVQRAGKHAGFSRIPG